MKFDVIKANVNDFVGKAGVKVKHYTPEILLGAGIAGFTATAVTASVITAKKFWGTKNIHDNTIKDIEADHDAGITNDKEYKQFKRKENLEYAGDLVKAYWPAAAMAVGSSALLISSDRILRKRQAVLVQSLGAVTAAFATYRERVKEELGKEKEFDIYKGIHEEGTSTYVDENGVVEEVDKTSSDGGLFTVTVRPGDPGYDRHSFDYTIESAQSFLNNQMRNRVKPAIFVNDILDIFQQPRTALGQIAGWRSEVHFPDKGIEDENSRHVQFHVDKRYEDVEYCGKVQTMPVWDITFETDGNVTDAL